MKVLLDTCTFLWLSLDFKKLSATAVSTINNSDHTFFLSDVSLWEITLKNTSGKLPLPASPKIWLPEQRDFHQLIQFPIRQSEILLTSELPPLHSDPFDRLIAAQAISENFTILSPDKPLSLLGAARLW